MNTISYKLKELRNEKELSQKELANILQVAPSTISMWEQDKREPDGDMIMKIANYFDVSTDYILGRNNNTNSYKYTKELGKRLKSLRESKNLLSKDLAKIMNVEPPTITNWEKGNRFPKEDILIKLADYFDVSLDYLFGRDFSNDIIKIDSINIVVFGERLKQLRKANGITLDQLKDELNTTKATISRYENGLREPKIDFLIKVSKYFQVSTDYLLGLNDNSCNSYYDKLAYDLEKENFKITSENYNKILLAAKIALNLNKK
ncbi:TPA: helix-turn-helix domain-containing protein [Clostridium perfringens]